MSLSVRPVPLAMLCLPCGMRVCLPFRACEVRGQRSLAVAQLLRAPPTLCAGAPEGQAHQLNFLPGCTVWPYPGSCHRRTWEACARARAHSLGDGQRCRGGPGTRPHVPCESHNVMYDSDSALFFCFKKKGGRWRPPRSNSTSCFV